MVLTAFCCCGRVCLSFVLLFAPSSSFLVVRIRFARLTLCDGPLVRCCLPFRNVILLICRSPTENQPFTLVWVCFAAPSSCSPISLSLFCLRPSHSLDCPPSSALAHSRDATQCSLPPWLHMNTTRVYLPTTTNGCFFPSPLSVRTDNSPTSPLLLSTPRKIPLLTPRLAQSTDDLAAVHMVRNSLKCQSNGSKHLLV